MAAARQHRAVVQGRGHRQRQIGLHRVRVGIGLDATAQRGDLRRQQRRTDGGLETEALAPPDGYVGFTTLSDKVSTTRE